VLNASVELARAFLQKQMGESFFRIAGFENKISKTQKWEEDLELYLEVEQSALDDFFINLQKNKKAEMNFEITIKNKNLTARKEKLSPDPTTKQKLMDKFVNDIERLEELTGRDLSSWKII